MKSHKPKPRFMHVNVLTCVSWFYFHSHFICNVSHTDQCQFQIIVYKAHIPCVCVSSFFVIYNGQNQYSCGVFLNGLLHTSYVKYEFFFIEFSTKWKLRHFQFLENLIETENTSLICNLFKWNSQISQSNNELMKNVQWAIIRLIHLHHIPHV